MPECIGHWVKLSNRRRKNDQITNLGLYFQMAPDTDKRIYAASTSANEIGAIFSSVDGEILPPGQIRIFCRETGSKEISDIISTRRIGMADKYSTNRKDKKDC